MRRKPSGSHGCGPRNRQRNTQSSRLSHSLDPTPTHACRLDDEGRPVRRERCIETLATPSKAGLGRRAEPKQSVVDSWKSTVKHCMELSPDTLVIPPRQQIFDDICGEGMPKCRGMLLGLRTPLRTVFSVPSNTPDVDGYEVEEDDGSPQLGSIWKQMQANRRANMLLLSRVFRRGRDETISVC